MSTHKSPHVNKLMNGRTEHHHSGVNKLMHNGKHRAEGGTMGGSSMSGMPMMSSMPYNASHYSEGGEAEKKRRGGKVHRRHRAEGGGLYAINSDRMGVNPVTGKEHPKALRRGGRSCHAEGGTPYADGGEMGTEMYRHGGRAHSRRRHHSEGEEVALKRAMGGSGKVRKGMMNEDGSLR